MFKVHGAGPSGLGQFTEQPFPRIVSRPWYTWVAKPPGQNFRPVVMMIVHVTSSADAGTEVVEMEMRALDFREPEERNSIDMQG